jgi:hypothetical protein
MDKKLPPIQKEERPLTVRELQYYSGRLGQMARAQAGEPPRAFKRAMLNAEKPGRRGRKARARAERILKAH